MGRVAAASMLLTLLSLTIAPALRESEAQEPDGGGFTVVINESNPEGVLKKKELSMIFLKKMRTWSDGSDIVPIDLKPDSPVRERFSKGVHERPTQAVVAYWRQKIFSGRDTPPQEVSSDAEVLALIKANPGAIGYVADTTDTTGVKVVELL